MENEPLIMRFIEDYAWAWLYTAYIRVGGKLPRPSSQLWRQVSYGEVRFLVTGGPVSSYTVLASDSLISVFGKEDMVNVAEDLDGLSVTGKMGVLSVLLYDEPGTLLRKVFADAAGLDVSEEARRYARVFESIMSGEGKPYLYYIGGDWLRVVFTPSGAVKGVVLRKLPAALAGVGFEVKRGLKWITVYDGGEVVATIDMRTGKLDARKSAVDKLYRAFRRVPLFEEALEARRLLHRRMLASLVEARL